MTITHRRYSTQHNDIKKLICIFDMQHNHAQHNSTITNKILYHCASKCCYAVFMNVFDRKKTSNSVARTYIKSLGYNNPWNSY